MTFDYSVEMDSMASSLRVIAERLKYLVDSVENIEVSLDNLVKGKKK